MLSPLNSPVDLLRFPALTPQQRLRVGFTAVYGKLASAKGLDDLSVEEWLTKTSGRKAFQTFWLPLLRAKFGDRYHDVPAMWFWTRFHREKGDSEEVKGYIRGGYATIVQALEQRLSVLGARIRKQTPVDGIDLNGRGEPIVMRGDVRETFDRVIATAPFVVFRDSLARGVVRKALPPVTESLDLQGIVNTVLITDRPLSRHYWIAAVDADLPFQGIVEPSTLVRAEDRGGYSLLHVLNYTHRSDALFSESQSEISSRMVDALLRAFPAFPREAILQRFVFRAPYVEPLLTLGYTQKRPPIELIRDRVFLASTSQVYPDITSWNGSLALVERVVESVSNAQPIIEREQPTRIAV